MGSYSIYDLGIVCHTRTMHTHYVNTETKIIRNPVGKGGAHLLILELCSVSKRGASMLGWYLITIFFNSIGLCGLGR